MLARSQLPSAVAAPSPGSDVGQATDALVRDNPPDTPDASQDLPACESPDCESLVWTVNLAQRQPLRVALALLAVSIVWWVALAAFRSPLMALVGSLAVLGSVAEGLFPIHYRLASRGVTARCAWQVRAMSWEAVRSVWQGPDGVYLCPFARPSWLTRTRGVVLRFADGNDSAVLALVRRYWKQDGAPEDPAGGPVEETP